MIIIPNNCSCRWLSLVVAVSAACLGSGSRSAAAADLPDNPIALDPRLACGPMCLAFLDSYFGNDRGYVVVAGICPPGASGSSLLQLQEGARKLGYYGEAVHIDAERLKLLSVPVVLHCRNSDGCRHFVVCLGYNSRDGGFTIFDPPRKLVRVNGDELQQQMLGLGLVVSDRRLPPIQEMLDPELRWRQLVVAELLICGSGLTIFGLLLFLRGGKAPASRATILLFLGLIGVNSPSCSPGGADSASHIWLSRDTVEPHSLDLGDVLQGEDVNATFSLVNTTQQSFKILRVDRSCSCQVVSADTLPAIPAGGCGRISVAMKTDSIAGPVEKTIRVVTDSPDPRFSAVEMRLRVNVVVPFNAIPSRVVFEQVKPGKRAVRTLRVVTTPPELADRFLNAKCELSFLRVALQGRSPGTLLFNIEVAPDSPQGTFASRILLTFDDPRYRHVSVPVVIRRVGPLSVTPRVVIVNRYAKSSDVKLLERSVTVRSTNGKRFRIARAEAPDGAIVLWKRGLDPQSSVQIIVRLNPTHRFRDGEVITIYTESEEASFVQVPIVVAR